MARRKKDNKITKNEETIVKELKEAFLKGEEIKIVKEKRRLYIRLPDGRMIPLSILGIRVRDRKKSEKILEQINALLSDIDRTKNLTPLTGDYWHLFDSEGFVKDETLSKSMDLSREAKNQYSLTLKGIYNYVRRGRDRADLIGFDSHYRVEREIAKEILDEAVHDLFVKKAKLKKDSKPVREFVRLVHEFSKEGYGDERRRIEPFTPISYSAALEDAFRIVVNKYKIKDLDLKDIDKYQDKFMLLAVEELNRRAKNRKTSIDEIVEKTFEEKEKERKKGKKSLTDFME